MRKKRPDHTHQLDHWMRDIDLDSILYAPHSRQHGLGITPSCNARRVEPQSRRERGDASFNDFGVDEDVRLLYGIADDGSDLVLDLPVKPFWIDRYPAA